MLTWVCDIAQCERASLPFKGDCWYCMKHLCEVHVALPHHYCLIDEDAQDAASLLASQLSLQALAADIDALDLAASAEKLHHSKVAPLAIDIHALPQGGMNAHVPIDFEDGTRWMARIRQKRFDSPPRVMSRIIMDSEICALIALGKAGVMVPAVHVPARTSSGASDFFFLDFVNGHPSGAPFHTDLSPDQITTLITSYAKASAQIAEVSFTGIGSLHPSPDTQDPIVGPLISLDFCQSAVPHFLGPFRTSRDRYLAQIDLTLAQLTGAEGVKPEGEAMYYTHLWLRDVVMEVEELGRAEATYIKHADDKGDHVMVDKEGEVTGIIDWEWGYTAPKAEAFAGPLAVVDVAAFFAGSNELSTCEVQLAEAYDAIGRGDLGDCVRRGKLYQRLAMVIGAEPQLAILHALQELVYGRKGREKDTETWVEGLKSRYGATEVESELV